MNRTVKVELRGATVSVLQTGKPWHVCHSCCLAWRAPLLMCLLLALGPIGATGREEGTCGSCGPQGLQCSVSDNDCDRPLPFIKAPPGMATDLRVEITASKGKLWLQVHWSLPLDASVHAITHLLLEVLYSDLELHCVLFTLAHPLSSQRAPDGGKWRFSYDCISVEPQDLVIINVYTLPLGTPPLSTRFQVQDCHEETMTRLAPQHCQGPHLSVISYVAEDGEVVIDYNSSFLSKRHAAFPCLSRGTACLTQRLVPHGLAIATGSSGQFHLRGLPALPCLCVQVFPVDVSHQRAQVCPFFQKRWMQVEGNVQVLSGIITVQIKVLPQQCSMRLWLCLWVLDQGEAGRPVSGTQREALIGNWTLEYSLNKALVQEAAGNTLCVKVWSDGKFLMEDKVFCPSGKWSGVADAVLGGGVALFFLVLLLLLVRYLKSNRAVDTGEQGQLLMLHAADSHPMRKEVLSLASRLTEHLGRTPLLDLWDHRGMATLGLHGWLLHHRAALDRVGGWIILMMSPVAVTKLRRDHCEGKSGNALAQSDVFSVAVPSIMSDQLDDTWSGRYVLVFPPNTRNCQDLPTALHGRPVFSLWQDFEALCNHLSARSKTKLCITGHKRLKSIWL